MLCLSMRGGLQRWPLTFLRAVRMLSREVTLTTSPQGLARMDCAQRLRVTRGQEAVWLITVNARRIVKIPEAVQSLNCLRVVPGAIVRRVSLKGWSLIRRPNDLSMT